MDGVLIAALIAATLTTGLVAGLLWGWAVSVMPALRDAPDAVFVEFMQRANVAIINGWFVTCFAGAVVLDVLALILAAVDGRGAVAVWSAIALVLYAATIGITRLVNIPLNNRIAAAGEPGRTADPGAIRTVFERPWVRWNVIRSLTGIASLGALSGALLAA
jgi:uncharacterized membrane protein